MTKHTATPWYTVNEDFTIRSNDFNSTAGMGDYRGVIIANLDAGDWSKCCPDSIPVKQANAAFICKAVNSHDALVEALNGLISASATVFDHTQAHLKNSVKLDYITYKANAERALKLAEGRE